MFCSLAKTRPAEKCLEETGQIMTVAVFRNNEQMQSCGLEFRHIILCRPRTYPFFEDIYPILYHGQKSDIISYPISRQKIEKGYISYILSNFILASKT
jgi:hypothetical protein